MPVGSLPVAVDEFYLKNQTPEPTAEEIEAKLAKSKKNKKNRDQAVKDKAEQSASDVAATEEPSKNPNENPSAEPAPEPTTEAPVENINITEKSLAIEPETLDQKIDKISEATPPVIEVKPEPPVEQPIVQPVEPPPSLAVTKPEATAVEEIKIPSQENFLESKSSSENNMASKIIETLVETPPPPYDQLGRGLVYNCKDKYWACVDRSAYLICNKNLKYNESVGKNKECVVQAIYATDEDCAKVQKYNVSVSQPTDFCKN